MIDVWIRTTSENYFDPVRRAMTSVTAGRWEKEKGVRVSWIRDRGIQEGRDIAERASEGEAYIVTDDDVLIVGKDWVKRAVDALLGSPEYGAVSSLSLIETENLAIAPPDTPKGSIYPMHAVGAPMVIRKGLMVDLPEMDLNSECGVIHKFLLDKGYKEGLVNGLRHNHMGHGFSSNPALFWGY